MPSEAGIADCRVSECDRKTVPRCGTHNVSLVAFNSVNQRQADLQHSLPAQRMRCRRRSGLVPTCERSEMCLLTVLRCSLTQRVKQFFCISFHCASPAKSRSDSIVSDAYKHNHCLELQWWAERWKFWDPIYKISYDNLTIMPKLRSTYDIRLIYKKTSYEGRKAFLRYDSLADL